LSIGLQISSNFRFYERILRAIINFHYWLLNGILKAVAFTLFPLKKINQAKKIIIFRTGSLGDSVCALPAIYSIRKNFPDAQIDILTNAGAENLVSLGALIDRTIVNEIINYFGMAKTQLFKLLKDRKYDLFIQLPQYDAGFERQIRDIFIAKALGVKYAFGWQVDSTWFLAKYQSKLISFENERDRLLRILEKNGLKSYGLVFPLGISDEIKSKIRNVTLSLPARRGGSKGDTELNTNKNVGMVVGAKRPQNRWPIEYFKEVADYLLKQNKNILLFGGQEDFELAEKIKGDKVFNFCGKLSPLETAEMMKYCKLIISNDTGPMHLAYAVGTPLIAIFSSRDYAGKWFPPEDGENIILRNDIILCTDCFDSCKRSNECLKKIKPMKVIGIFKLILT